MITNKLYLKFILTEKDYCISFYACEFPFWVIWKLFHSCILSKWKKKYIKSLLILLLQVFYANICTITFYTCNVMWDFLYWHSLRASISLISAFFRWCNSTAKVLWAFIYILKCQIGRLQKIFLNKKIKNNFFFQGVFFL